MSKRIRYRKHRKYHLTAVQLDLEFDGFSYQKWGKIQTCRPGDWLVNNNGDVYTVDKEYFRDYYQRISQGVYEKVGDVWAEEAHESGSIQTKEGFTDYNAGDYLVFDYEEGGNAYAVKKHKFEEWYEKVDPEDNLTDEQKHYIDKYLSSKIKDFALKAKIHSYNFHIWQVLAILAAALVPVQAGFITDDTTTLKWSVAFLGGASAVIAGLLSLFSFQKNWMRYKSAYLALESQLEQYKVATNIYADKKNSFDLLVENCERILDAEKGHWSERSNRECSQNGEG